MKRERTKILIEPYDLTIENTQQGLRLKIIGRTNKGKGKDHEIIFEFKSWWIKYFLKDFRKIIELKRQELDTYEKGFNKEQQT